MMFLSAFGIIALILASISWLGSNRVIHPRRQIEKRIPEDFALPVQDVTFSSADDTRLSGWFMPGRNGATVIMLHGYGRSRGELLPQAAFLYRAGYAVLLFDFRHRGSSGGDSVTLGAKEPLDVFGALNYLQSRPDVDPGRIGVMGVSLGASVGIIAAAVTPEIKVVVAEAAFHTLRSVVERGMRSFVGLPTFPFALTIRAITERRLKVSIDDIEPANVVGQIAPRAVMLIHGIADEQIPFEATRTLYWQAKEPKYMWLVPGAPHATAYQYGPQEYESKVLGFLAEHL
jgi:dipeptidyl aminopeptidase/acylaminoacyl peptidase